MSRLALAFDQFAGHGAGRSRRAMLSGLGGSGLAAALPWATGRPAAAHGADEVARAAMDALNQALATGDDRTLDAVFAADVTVQPRHRLLTTGETVSPDLAGLKAALADIRRAAPDVTLAIEDLIAEEDKAAGRFTFRGTLGPAAQPITGNGLVFLVVRDDRVAQLWLYPDPYAMMAVIVMALLGQATPTP